MKTLARLASALAALLLTGTLHAQVPPFLNYQGRVAVNGVNFDGTGQFKFALINGAGTTTYWSNSPDLPPIGGGPADGVPDFAVSLTVTKGLYSVLLGDSTLANMNGIPFTIFANPDVRLRVWFNDGTNGTQLITPDQPIASAGYAMRSATAALAGFAARAGTVYGDGSAGDYMAPLGTSTLDVSNPQYNTFTVPFGRTLHIPSGLTIHCTSTFTNNGTIIVDPAGYVDPPGGTIGNTPGAFVIGSRGIARTDSAYSAGYYASDFHPTGSFGAKAYPRSQLKAIFTIGLDGGGAGYPSFRPTGAYQANSVAEGLAFGGGSLRIVAQGTLNNSGSIQAIGQSGLPATITSNENDAGRVAGGGGAGGIVILASATSIIQSGIVDASGGIGGAAAVATQTLGNPPITYLVSNGPGGAGGGGLIRLLSPEIISTGQNIVLAGAKQTVPSPDYFYFFGALGGASAGDGAGSTSDDGISLILEDAGNGLVLTNLCNPAGLLGN